MTAPLWQPSAAQISQTNLAAFLQYLKAQKSLAFSDYHALYDWSVGDLEGFWSAVWDFCDVIAEGDAGQVLVNGDQMPGAQFFPATRLNYAENLLRRRDDGDAMVFWGEDKVQRRLSHRDLYDTVSRLSQMLTDLGVSPGDRVAGFMPNMPETVIAALATAAIGAVWSSCSPDFGKQGVLDRFGQIEPKVLFCPDGYYYNGKAQNSIERVAGFAPELPSLKRVIVVPYLSDRPDVSPIDNAGTPAVTWDQALRPYEAGEIAFVRQGFNDPLFIMFSSGTTGKPKCIIHGIGGTLLQHLKEHQLLCNVRPDDRVFYFTTCGWMMWNWLISALASRATLLLYDGSPFFPNGNILFDFMEAEKGTLFGTSAKYIDALGKTDLSPLNSHDLPALRTVTSTGSPLAPEGFDTVYTRIKKDVCLSSIAGGTDIMGCFLGGNPIGPVWRGEIQARCLAMAVEVFDDDGKPLADGKGELVCTKPFPSMPLGFWDDPEEARYRAAYFETYPNIWRHGDFISLTEHGGAIIFGRSDATLNPGGVRIGTAEIYRQVEKLPEVEESLVIGQDWESDVRVVLFVKTRNGITLDEDLIKKIKTQVRNGCTPRHVPAKVIQVADIPRTKSGKIVELAVRDIVHGRPVKNKEALANPDALDLYKDIAELAV